MTKDALRDAFAAGWNIGKSSGGGPDHAFDIWYQNALDTLDRSPTIIGIDLAAPSSDIGVTYIVGADGRPVIKP